MKKKVTSTKKTTSRVKRSSTSQPVIFRRVLIISACVLLVVIGISTTKNNSVTRAVAGTSIARGLFMQATIQMPNIPGAAAYNLYYKETEEKDFTNAVRNISPNVPNYTVSYLKKGTSYQYRLSAIDKDGQEFLFSETRPVTDLQPM